MRFDVHPTTMKQKQGAPCGRTLPKATDKSDMYNRAFPVGNALFLLFALSLCASCYRIFILQQSRF